VISKPYSVFYSTKVAPVAAMVVAASKTSNLRPEDFV